MGRQTDGTKLTGVIQKLFFETHLKTVSKFDIKLFFIYNYRALGQDPCFHTKITYTLFIYIKYVDNICTIN
jgi:hypothetical protein